MPAATLHEAHSTDWKPFAYHVRNNRQVAEEERKQKLDNVFRDVAGVLAEKCVNPDSGRPYTLALLERALKDVHFNVDPKRSAKQQALEVCARPMITARAVCCYSAHICGLDVAR
jgi:hypothetical protein